MTAYAELGTRLRDARQKAGRTTSDVAADTGLPERYVVALEEGDMSAMPDLSYARLYLQSYARHLNLDTEALLGAWPASRPSEPEKPAAPAPGRGWRKAVWIGAAVVVLAGVVGLGAFRGRFESAPAAGGESEESADLARESPIPAAETPVLPAVIATSDSAPDSHTQPAPGAALEGAVTLAEPPAEFRAEPAESAPGTAVPATPPASELNVNTAAPEGIPTSPFLGDLPAWREAPARTLTVVAAAQTWLVIEADRDTVAARVVAKGESVSVQAKGEFRLTVANSRDLQVTLDGQPVVLDVRSDRPLIRHLIVGKDSP